MDRERAKAQMQELVAEVLQYLRSNLALRRETAFRSARYVNESEQRYAEGQADGLGEAIDEINRILEKVQP